MQDEPLIDIKEVARMLGISERKAASLVRDGEIPRYKVGRLAKYKRSDVREYIKRQRQVRRPSWKEQYGI